MRAESTQRTGPSSCGSRREVFPVRVVKLRPRRIQRWARNSSRTSTMSTSESAKAFVYSAGA